MSVGWRVALLMLLSAPGLTQAPYDLAAVRTELDAISAPLALPEGWLGFSDDGRYVCIGRKRFAAIDGALVPQRKADLAGAAQAAGARPPLSAPQPAPQPCVLALTDAHERRFELRLEAAGWIARAVPAPPVGRIVRPMFPMYRYDRREELSPQGDVFASLAGYQLALRPTDRDEAIALTDDGTEQAPYFLGSDIWEQSGEIFSTDGRYFIGRQHDAGEATPVDVHDPFQTTGAEIIHFRYWSRVGQPLPRQTLVIVDSQRRTVTRVRGSGRPESFSFFVEWSPAGTHFLWLRVSRDLKRYELLETSAMTGRSRRLLVETQRQRPVKWPGGPQTARYLPDQTGYLWRSNRSGYAQYYRLPKGGGPLQPLTTGDFDAEEVVRIDGPRRRLYYYGAGDPVRSFDRRLLSVALPEPSDSAMPASTVLTAEAGVHDVQLSRTGKRLLDVHSHVDRLPAAVLRDGEGQPLRTLWQAAPPTARARRPSPIEFEVALGQERGRAVGLLFPPAGFDPDKRYPVIDRIYGAVSLPATPRGYPGFEVSDDYGRVIHMLTASGFAVVTIDAPGVLGRGAENENARYGRWPEGLIADHRAVLEALAVEHEWLDLARVGVAGNSWGGYSALLAGLDAPQLYRAVSASVPQTSLRDHISWIEFMLGLPKENPTAYADGELAERMDEWQPALQLIAGTADVNVPVSNTYRVLDALAEAGKPYELVLFPGTNHAHSGRGDRYAYAVAAMRRFFRRTLGGAEECNAP
ncbi:MAG: prolyl oligopeptidase family serine peptidase [Pseudomonadota bacterium]